MPPSERQPWIDALRKVLSDGEWHSEAVVLTRMAAAVPPGRAVRASDRDQERVSGHARIRPRTYAERERIGQRAVARDSLRAWVTHGAVQRRGEGRDREVRLKPVSDRGWSVNQLANHLHRSPTTVHGWLRLLSAVAEVGTLLPPDLVGKVPVVTANDAGAARIPVEAIPAWEAYSRTRKGGRSASWMEFEKLVEAVAAVFDQDQEQAEDRVKALFDYMATGQRPEPSSTVDSPAVDTGE